jgi:predicted ester cyclase
MSTPEAVVRTWFDEVWNERRLDSIDRFFTPNVVSYGLPGGEMRGPDNFKPLHTAFCGAFPDIHVAIERTVAQGEMVAAHVRVTGTHRGDTLGFASTGRSVDFQGMLIARIVEGEFREVWNCFDFLSMYQQLGVPPPA